MNEKRKVFDFFPLSNGILTLIINKFVILEIDHHNDFLNWSWYWSKWWLSDTSSVTKNMSQ